MNAANIHTRNERKFNTYKAKMLIESYRMLIDICNEISRYAINKMKPHF